MRNKRWLILVLPLLFLALLAGIYSLACHAERAQPGASGHAICSSLLYRWIPANQKLLRYRPAGQEKPVLHIQVPQHPFMAGNAGNNMHNDAYMSDTSEAQGPLGIAPQVRSRTQGFGGYGTLAYDRAGRLVGVYGNGRGFQLELMDPYTLQELASYDLPPRPAYFLLQGVLPWEYIGAGIYFYLDNQERAVIPTTGNTIRIVQTPDPQTGGSFELVREYDLSSHVVPMSWPHQDSVAWVLPEWSGEYYWYATTGGMVGTVQVETGAVHTLRLENEIIENSFAVGEEGLFIISDYALYRFSRDELGNILTDWRLPYDRGPGQKPGHITRGSGTSVTLLGGKDGVVAVTDNAEPRIHLLFVRRSDGQLLCSMPLFQEGKSGTDITVIGVEQADEQGRSAGVYSAIAENNWGHHFFPFARPEPGITRVDLTRQPDGSYRCAEVWTSNERNIGVFKMSLGSGLVYLYFRDDSLFPLRWYFTALDFWTGETVYKALAGSGMGFNNWAGALFLHPDGGIAYSTTIFGLVMLQDSSP
jgi:hypothetical protein